MTKVKQLCLKLKLRILIQSWTTIVMTVLLQSAGGFSKTSRPYYYTNNPTNQDPDVRVPKSQPFVIFEDPTQPYQVCTNVFADISTFVILSPSKEFPLSAPSWLAGPKFEKVQCN